MPLEAGVMGGGTIAEAVVFFGSNSPQDDEKSSSSSSSLSVEVVGGAAVDFGVGIAEIGFGSVAVLDDAFGLIAAEVALVDFTE